jgi:hypothetical protein
MEQREITKQLVKLQRNLKRQLGMVEKTEQAIEDLLRQVRPLFECEDKVFMLGKDDSILDEGIIEYGVKAKHNGLMYYRVAKVLPDGIPSAHSHVYTIAGNIPKELKGLWPETQLSLRK